MAARDILLQFFPPELVYIILDAAQYWVYATSLREQYARIDASVLHLDISLCYLVTAPILDGCTHKGETIHLRVVSVEFTMFSRDRGGSDYQDTYPEYSWFEAAILRLSQAPDAVPWITSAANAPVELDLTMGYDPKLEVQGAGPNGDKSRWPVQRNYGGERFLTYVVTWNEGAVASESSHGAGDGRRPTLVSVPAIQTLCSRMYELLSMVIGNNKYQRLTSSSTGSDTEFCCQSLAAPKCVGPGGFCPKIA
ncbi:hypothetical protein DFH06DRAFT_1345848 [Mycena polygramma]|nr:hypothetical protein DFH06DRAFT_1345848 [Mycena polygramma]